MKNKKKIDSETSSEWQKKWKYYKEIEILEAVVLDPKKKSKWQKEVYIKDFSNYFDVKTIYNYLINLIKNELINDEYWDKKNNKYKINQKGKNFITNKLKDKINCYSFEINENNLLVDNISITITKSKKWIKIYFSESIITDITEFIEEFFYKKFKKLNQYWKIEEKTDILNDRVYKLIYNNDIQKTIVNLSSVLESNFYNILKCSIYDFKLVFILNNNFANVPKMSISTNRLVNIVKKLYIKKQLNLLDNKFKDIIKKYNNLIPLKYRFTKKRNSKKREKGKENLELKLQTNLNFINLLDIKKVFNIKSFFQNHESLFSQDNDFEEPDKQALYLNIEDSEGKTLENLETKIFKLWDENKFFVKVILDSKISSEWQKEDMKSQEKNIEISWKKIYKYVFFTERWEYLKWSLKNNQNKDG